MDIKTWFYKQLFWFAQEMTRLENMKFIAEIVSLLQWNSIEEKSHLASIMLTVFQWGPLFFIHAIVN